MESLITLLELLNGFSPLGIIALLVVVLWYQSRNAVTNAKHLSTIQENHLHPIPDMEDSLKRIETLLQSMNDNLIWVRARMNGGSK